MKIVKRDGHIVDYCPEKIESAISKANAEVVEEDLWVKNGDKVESFEGANNAIGTLVLKFQIAEELEYAITHQSDWMKVVVK